MNKYIDADKLKTQIQFLIDSGYDNLQGNLYHVLSIITAPQQEQPEVDLEKELEEAARRYKPNGDFGWGTLNNIAYYFYELGLKARTK